MTAEVLEGKHVGINFLNRPVTRQVRKRCNLAMSKMLPFYIREFQ